MEFTAKALNSTTFQFKALVVSQITNQEIEPLNETILSLLSTPAGSPGGPRSIGVLFCFTDMVKILLGGFTRISNNISVQNTVFGQIPVVSTCSSVNRNGSYLINIERFWDLEYIGILPEEQSRENEVPESFLQDFLQKVTFDKGMYATILNLNHEKNHISCRQLPTGKETSPKPAAKV